MCGAGDKYALALKMLEDGVVALCRAAIEDNLGGRAMDEVADLTARGFDMLAAFTAETMNGGGVKGLVMNNV